MKKNQNNAELLSSKSFLGSDFRTVIYGTSVTIIPTGSFPRTCTLSYRHTELKEFMRFSSSAETRQVHREHLEMLSAHTHRLSQEAQERIILLVFLFPIRQTQFIKFADWVHCFYFLQLHGGEMI